MKHEWKKHEKQYYLPKVKPEIVEIPEMNFFMIQGKGNPNDDFFSEYIGILYSLSYAVRMSPKKGTAPDGYYEYTVYPLEGVWSLTAEGRAAYDGTIDKDQLAFSLMIRQPGFVGEEFAYDIIEKTKKNKPDRLLDEVRFSAITEGKCVQMLHQGPYDNEAASFKLMESFSKENGLKRLSKDHREIYLSDARKTNPERLKTILRFRAG